MNPQIDKVKLVDTLIMVLAENTHYTPSIWKKYVAIGKEKRKIEQEVQGRGAAYVEKVIKENEGLTRDNLQRYVETDKMPPKMRPSIEQFKKDVDDIVGTLEINIPKFNWLEKRFMRLKVVDLLTMFDLIDKRKWKCFFKTEYKKF